jgi:long-chain acyl-CoA synthetase
MPAHWSTTPLPLLRREALFGERIVRCLAPRPSSVAAMLSDTAHRHGQHTALITEGSDRWTWREVLAQVQSCAGGLRRQGIEAGDRMVVLVSNRPEFVVLVLALQWLGAIAVPVGTREQQEGLQYILNQCGAKAIALDTDLIGRLPEAASTPLLRFRVLCGGTTPNLAHGVTQPDAVVSLDWVALLRGQPLEAPASVNEDDAAVILYTSGTTGRPKGAVLTHVNIVHSAMHYVACMGLGAADKSLLAVPATHVTGLIANVMAMLLCGGAVVLMAAFKARDFIALASRERVTHTLMVPAMYNLLLLCPEFEQHDLSAWRIGGYGGAPMPVSTIDALAQALPQLVLLNAYGATETTSPTTLMPAGQTRDHADSVGVCLPCAEVMVVDDEGCELAPGEVGEVWIAGPMVVRGYWANPEATASEFTAGWWHSGDLGSCDAQGYVRIFDRKKDMLNRGGYKVFSVEVENVLLSLPGVVEAAIVGKPCPVLGERVHAFIYAPEATLDLAAVQAFCAKRLADYKIPESVSWSDKPLPRNLNGKVLKRTLRLQVSGA